MKIQIEKSKSKQSLKKQPVINLSVDETKPLIGSHSPNTLRKGLITCCGLLTLGSTAVAVVYYFISRNKNATFTETPKISYSFTAPYQGAGTVVIHNENDFEIEVADIQFTTNALINTNKEGAVYGDLAPWGEAKIESISSNNEWQTYKVSEPTQKIFVGPNSSKNFTYVFDKALGVVNAGALPSDLAMTTTEGTYDLSLAKQCTDNSCNDPFKGKVVGAYYTDWDMYQRQYNAKDIPVGKLNHLYYAFLKYDSNGNISLLDSYSDNIQLPALMQLQQQFPYLKIYLSFGGYTLSNDFPALAQNPAARANFSRNVLALLQQFSFNGVDIDWEYPSKADSKNFVLLLKTLREHFTASGQKFGISLATSAGQDKIDAIGEDWKEIATYIDHINLMAYDYNGAWSTVSDYQSPLSLPINDPNGNLLAINATLSMYDAHQFPREKIVLGMPAYFRGVRVASMQNNGMWQPVTGPAQGQFEMGMYDYNCAISRACYGGTPLPADCVYLDEAHTFYGNLTHTPSIACRGELSVYSGDSTVSVKDKSCYAQQKNLKGVFFWALAGDERNDEQKSLLTAASNAFKNPSCKPEETHGESLRTGVISNEQEWKAFIQKTSFTIAGSYLSGLLFAGFFHLVDKLTEQLLEKTMRNKVLSQSEQVALYYSLKTLVYFGLLYSLGAPLLPAAVSKLLVLSLQNFLGTSEMKSQLTGAMAAFCLNAGTEFSSYEEVLFGALSFVASLAGGFTPSFVNKISSWIAPIKTFGFFGLGKTVEEKVQSFQFENKCAMTV